MHDDEDFLRVNANTDYMAGVLADCLRDCMRAVAADSPDDRRNRGVQHFSTLLRQFKHWQEPNLYDLFGKAIDELRPSHPDQYDDRKAIERAYIVAAERGIRFLTELTASDPAAGGRASRRQSEFMTAIKWIDEAVERSHRYYDAQRAADDAKDPEAAVRRAREAVANRKVQEAVLRSIAREVAPPRKPRRPKK